MSLMHVRMSCAEHSLWRANQFVLLEVWPRDLFFFEETQKSFQDNIVHVYCLGRCCSRHKCICVHAWKQMKKLMKTVSNVFNAERAATFQTIFSRTKNRQLDCLAVMVLVLPKRRVVTTRMENVLLFWKIYSSNHNQLHPNLFQERQKSFRLWNKRIASPLVNTGTQKFISIINSYTFSLQ